MFGIVIRLSLKHKMKIFLIGFNKLWFNHYQFWYLEVQRCTSHFCLGCEFFGSKLRVKTYIYHWIVRGIWNFRPSITESKSIWPLKGVWELTKKKIITYVEFEGFNFNIMIIAFKSILNCKTLSVWRKVFKDMF